MSDSDEQQYELFIEEALATGCVWGLESDEGWALCAGDGSEDSLPVMPFWSQPEPARGQCGGEWSGYRVTAVALAEFLDDWLPGLHEDLIMVGPNWDATLGGLEVEPLDLLQDFDEAAADMPD